MKIKYIVLSERSQPEKTTYHMIQLYNMLGKTDEEGSKKISSFQVWGGGVNIWSKASFYSSDYSVGYYDGRCIIYPNPQNIQCQKRTLV